jgi:hypothetical protein
MVVQNILLITLIILCILLVISLIKKPFDSEKNLCRFKILSPKYNVEGNKRRACFSIMVEKKHRYFINFPLSFKFYSHEQFKSHVKITYETHGEEGPQLLLDKLIEFTSKIKEQIVYVTDIIVGKITVEVFLDVEYGSPIVEFQILENNTCDLNKEYKLELIFPDR